jgi:hypothetical protein
LATALEAQSWPLDVGMKRLSKLGGFGQRRPLGLDFSISKVGQMICLLINSFMKIKWHKTHKEPC